jgi:hypothetical protein
MFIYLFIYSITERQYQQACQRGRITFSERLNSLPVGQENCHRDHSHHCFIRELTNDVMLLVLQKLSFFNCSELQAFHGRPVESMMMLGARFHLSWWIAAQENGAICGEIKPLHRKETRLAI